MLLQPSSIEPFRLVGIDPGTHSMGVSILEWDFNQPQYQIKTAFTLTPERLGFETIAELHGDRTARIQALGVTLQRVLHEVQPHAIISETPYMGRFVTSFASGTEMLLTIRHAVQLYNPYIPLYQVDPTTAKQSAGVDMKAFRRLKQEDDKKECVRLALLARNDLAWGVNPNTLDEHSVDAVAVALHFLLYLL